MIRREEGAHYFGILLCRWIMSAQGILETLGQLPQGLRLWLPRHGGVAVSCWCCAFVWWGVMIWRGGGAGSRRLWL